MGSAQAVAVHMGRNRAPVAESLKVASANLQAAANHQVASQVANHMTASRERAAAAASRNFDLKVLDIALKAAQDIALKAVRLVLATNVLAAVPAETGHESSMEKAQARRDHIKGARLVANLAAQAPAKNLMRVLLRAARKAAPPERGQERVVTKVAPRDHAQVKVVTNHAQHADVPMKVVTNHAHHVDVLTKAATNHAHHADAQTMTDMKHVHHVDRQREADMPSASNANARLKKDQKAARKRSALIARPAQPGKKVVAHALRATVAPVKEATPNVLPVDAAMPILDKQAATIPISFS